MADLLRSCWEDSSGKFGLLRSSTASSSFPIILRGNRVYFFLSANLDILSKEEKKINRQKAGIKKEKCIMAFVMPSSITLVNSLFSSNKVTAFIKKTGKTSQYLVRYVLRSVRVHQRVSGLVPVPVSGRDVGDHDGVAVARERVLQQTGQLGVTIVDVLGLAFREGVDAVAQGQKRPIDVGTLVQPLAFVLQGKKIKTMMVG